MGFKRWIIEQRYRFDMAMVFLALINFTLLIVANTNKIEKIGLKVTPLTTALFVSFIFILLWLVGIWMDKIKYFDTRQGEQFKRDPVFNGILNELKQIEEDLKK